MKIRILKSFQQDQLHYPKDSILDLHDWGGRWYMWSDKSHDQIIVFKSFIDDRIKKGIIQVI